MYGEIICNEQAISNRQFITDIDAFENTNPSQNNRELNSLRKSIESGDFSTRKIIDYLCTISKERQRKTTIKVGAVSERKEVDELQHEEESELLYLSYEEVHERIKGIEEIKNAKGYTEYKSVRLWDSIFAYLKEAKRNEEDVNIDEEETENVDNSTGREEKVQKKIKQISRANYDRIRDRLVKFLDGYFSFLETKIKNPSEQQPNLIDLSMYLIFMEVLFHLASHKESIKDENRADFLIPVPMNSKAYSWSDYLIQFIGMFTLWSKRQGGFKQLSNEAYTFKLKSYKEMAYKTTVSALSLFVASNKRYDLSKIIAWRNMGLLNANMIFNTEMVVYKDWNLFDEFIPIETKAELGMVNINQEIVSCITFINNFPINNIQHEVYYNHSQDGFSLIDKIIGTERDFFKLVNIGYEWDDEFLNFWNGKVYSVAEKRWYSSMKK